MREEARTDEQDARRGRQLLPQVAEQVDEPRHDHGSDHEDRRDADDGEEQRIGECLAHARHELRLLLEMFRHLLERQRQLAPPFTGAQHAQHDAGHHASCSSERLCETVPLQQTSARVGERIAQRAARERLARRHSSVERHARRD